MLVMGGYGRTSTRQVTEPLCFFQYADLDCRRGLVAHLAHCRALSPHTVCIRCESVVASGSIKSPDWLMDV